MGLEQFDVAPDNQGGRPEKDEEERTGHNSTYGEALEMSRADEEWWEEILEEVLGVKTMPCDDYEEFSIATMRLADYTHSLGHSVWRSMKEENAGGVDWEWFKEEAPDELVRRVFPNEFESGSSSSSRFGSSSGKQAGDGLTSIIDAAK